MPEIALKRSDDKDNWTAALAARLLPLLAESEDGVTAARLYKSIDKVSFGKPTEEDLENALNYLDEKCYAYSDTIDDPEADDYGDTVYKLHTDGAFLVMVILGPKQVLLSQ